MVSRWLERKRLVPEAQRLIRCHPPRLLVLDVELRDESYRAVADLLLQLRPEAELLFITAMAGVSCPPQIWPAARWVWWIKRRLGMR